MRPDWLLEVKMRQPDWRVADLHDLRIRYAALRADIAAHRRAVLERGDPTPADLALWDVLENAAVAEQADAPDSNSVPERGAGSIPAGGTYSDYHRAKELEQSLRKIYHTVTDEYVCLFP